MDAAEADAGADAGWEDAAARDAEPTLSAYLRELAAAWCDYQRRCFQFEPLRPTLAGCLAAEEKRWSTQLASIYGPMVAVGAVQFDQVAARACVETVLQGDCYVPDLTDTACDNVFVGTRPLGAPCSDSLECDPAGYCRRAGPACGACVPRLGLDEECGRELEACTGDLACDWRAARATCQPRRTLGEACGRLGGVCQGYLRCDSTSASCVRPGRGGEPCPTANIFEDCDILYGVICAVDTCAPMSFVPLGEMCEIPTVQCREGYCGGGGICSVARVEGAPCSGDECEWPLYCGAGGTCQRLRRVGEACDGELLCEDALVCEPTGASRVCRLPIWRPCGE